MLLCVAFRRFKPEARGATREEPSSEAATEACAQKRAEQNDYGRMTRLRLRKTALECRRPGGGRRRRRAGGGTALQLAQGARHTGRGKVPPSPTNKGLTSS